MVDSYHSDAASTSEGNVATQNVVDDESASGRKRSRSTSGTISIPDADQTEQHGENLEALTVSLSDDPTPRIPTHQDDGDGEKKPSVNDKSTDGNDIGQDSPVSNQDLDPQLSDAESGDDNDELAASSSESGSRLPKHLQHVLFEKSPNQAVEEKVLGVGCYSVGGLAGLGLCAAVPVAFILPPVSIGLGIIGGAMLLGGFLGGLLGYNKPPQSGRHGGRPVGAHLAAAWQQLEKQGEFYTQYQRQCASRIPDGSWRHILHLKHPRGGAFTKQRVKIQRALVHVAHRTGADPQVVLDTKKQLENLAKQAAGQRSPDWNKFDNELDNIYKQEYRVRTLLPKDPSKDPSIVGEWLNDVVRDLPDNFKPGISYEELKQIRDLDKKKLLELFAVPSYNTEVVRSVRREILLELLGQIRRWGCLNASGYANTGAKKHEILGALFHKEYKAYPKAQAANKYGNADEYSDLDKSNQSTECFSVSLPTTTICDDMDLDDSVSIEQDSTDREKIDEWFDAPKDEWLEDGYVVTPGGGRFDTPFGDELGADDSQPPTPQPPAKQKHSV